MIKSNYTYTLQPNNMILRNEDQAWIPMDPNNRDYKQYLYDISH